MPKKCVILLLDGLGDRAIGGLEHQTPLQAAKTPVLDHLASRSACGLFHAALMGQALPSENAHFSMFGYDPDQFPGRGALEALGTGIPLEPNDVAVLAHFSCLKENRGVLYLDCGKPVVDRKDIGILVNAVRNFKTDDISLEFIWTHANYGIVRMIGEVSPKFTDTDPFIDGRALIEPMPHAGCPTKGVAEKSAGALKEYLQFAYHTLSNLTWNLNRKANGLLPINGIVTQRAGQLKPVTPFNKKYGLKACLMASGLVYHGLGKYLGMECKMVADTDQPEADIAQRIRKARVLLDDFDLIHVHTKVPDEAAHKKDPYLKKTVIEALDQGIGEAIGPLVDDPHVLLIITSDHSTPSHGQLIHSGEPVPVMINGQGVRRDLVRRFDEISMAGGALGTIRGKEMMYLILNYLDRAKLMGVMDTPEDQPFWPGEYKKFGL